MTRFALASLLCLAASLAQAAGFQRIEVPANGALPPLKGAIWYPCAKPPGEVKIGPNVLTVAEDCPIAGGKLPLVVISHGRVATSWVTTTRPRRWPTPVLSPSRSIIPAIRLVT